jgi:hypothetical protein
MFDPVKNLIAIYITDDYCDQGHCHEDSESVVLLISNRRALHREKISPGDAADDRDE